MENVGYFLEHLEELVVGCTDPLKKACLMFGLIFEQTPTYKELLFGNPQITTVYYAKKSLFKSSLYQ